MANILIIDDEKSIRIALYEILTNRGFTVYSARDAITAARIMDLNPIDVVITDILLPDINGSNLLVSIRSHSPDIKVILLTGEPNLDTCTIGLRAGAFDYLTKPIRKNDICRSVDKAVHIKTLDDENRRLARENRRYQELLEEMVDERTRQLARLSNRILQIQEEERSRISRELHDDLGQSLLALKLKYQSAYGRLESLSEENRTEFSEVLSYLNSIIDRSRELSHNLSPVTLANLGLPLAISEMVEDLNKNRDLLIELDLDDLNNFYPDNWEINVYRIIQESLTNIIKHASATRVMIEARRNAEKLSLIIRDNGSGIPDEKLTGLHGEEKKSTESGMGLQIIKKRVDLLGGEIKIHSEENHGTEIRIELPGNPVQNRSG